MHVHWRWCARTQSRSLRACVRACVRLARPAVFMHRTLKEGIGGWWLWMMRMFRSAQRSYRQVVAPQLGVRQVLPGLRERVHRSVGLAARSMPRVRWEDVPNPVAGLGALAKLLHRGRVPAHALVPHPSHNAAPRRGDARGSVRRWPWLHCRGPSWPRCRRWPWLDCPGPSWPRCRPHCSWAGPLGARAKKPGGGVRQQ